MKICDRHALHLRQEIEQRSMGHLITHDLEQQKAKAHRLTHREGRREDFDPWLLAQIHLGQELARALPNPGDVASLPPDLCPLCMVGAKNTIIEASWVRGCLDDLLEQAWKFGLMTKPGVVAGGGHETPTT